MRRSIIILFVFAFIFSGCAIFQKKYTPENIRSSTEATAIAERASSIGGSAERIAEDSEAGHAEIEDALAENEVDPDVGENQLARYSRISNEAELIDRLSGLNERSGERIIRVNMGSWHTSWWFKLIIGVIVVCVILFVLLAITAVAKQWGFIGYVRNVNEAMADGIADLLDKNDRIDNDFVPEELNRRIRQRKRRY